MLVKLIYVDGCVVELFDLWYYVVGGIGDVVD